ncbi:sirohydrochlorin chelatase [Undibacterium luofuense]|uniref:CbiX/SirB N-terminal domain-containing protein n=1 Tax=Undibacterium luofuense TaxID=2828733 RepID=A0A941I477_9BURK|nr:CbiX/SirB N-terminal domain-containing protein [Undibacterium luofuense]MBR7781362.1 CbiX/SirB N-terminal domain-containing protein [Undibacterium luofuense]
MKALILFAHGARDPRWAAPFERLRDTIRARQSDLRVELAFLEFMTPALPEIAVAMATDGVTEITLVPVFLGQGGHVLRDLPLLLEEIHQQAPQLKISLQPAVGESESVVAAMADYCLAKTENA